MLNIILILFFYSGFNGNPVDSEQDGRIKSTEAFLIHHKEGFSVDTMKIRYNSNGRPESYFANLDMPVCEDTLCRNMVLKVCWDMAGNYINFDTISGFPLTKFDHIPFSKDDYLKLDLILKDKNSPLRILGKDDLTDSRKVIKSRVVDAVTGATPKAIQNAVVQGAVYSSYQLWHLVNIEAKNKIRNNTRTLYSNDISMMLLFSDNYDTQLFAINQMSPEDLESSWETLLLVLNKSVPIVRAQILNKIPLPLRSTESNRKLVALFSKLDAYSQSIFLKRVTYEKAIATQIVPLLIIHANELNPQQLKICLKACQD